MLGDAAWTSLLSPSETMTRPEKGYTVLRRDGLEVVVVDNRAVDDEVLPGHAAGYHGIAAIRHRDQPRNMFVPRYAGLNFEHIHDGSTQDRAILFEPRNAAMELRVIDANTVDLYQSPTPFWGLESCMRYRLLSDGVIEMAFECIPRRDTFQSGYCGLFWASYIDQPESLDIHFKGNPEHAPPSTPPSWQRGITPAHGTLATHRGIDEDRIFPHDPDFPLTLAFGFSNQRYSEPWYFCVCRNMALMYHFRPEDQIWLTQSPSGGGKGCPAWDFQWFIPEPQIGKRYRFKMKAAYIPLKPEATLDEIKNQVLQKRTTLQHEPR